MDEGKVAPLTTPGSHSALRCAPAPRYARSRTGPRGPLPMTTRSNSDMNAPCGGVQTVWRGRVASLRLGAPRSMRWSPKALCFVH